MTNYTIQGIPPMNKLFIFIFFAISLLLTSSYSYAQCLPDVMANKTGKPSMQSQLQPQEGNEQKTENIRVITTLINSPEQLTGKAKVTVTFNEDENKQVTFQSNNKTITAEEETVFPLTLVKTVNKEAEEQPSTMNVCAVIEGFENTCDTVLLQENQTKPYRVTLELINFEELEPVS